MLPNNSASQKQSKAFSWSENLSLESGLDSLGHTVRDIVKKFPELSDF